MANVRWQEWGKSTKPILLYISASWCHWCHNMEKYVYHDTGIVKTIHEKFTPVRVDTDKRPDINRRYNMGGWPTNCILTPQGDLALGATYVPPEKMLTFLAQGLRRCEEGVPKTKPKDEEPSGKEEKLRKKVLEELKQAFDKKYGGFGTEPKFPRQDALIFLLQQRETEAKKMALKTLDEMSRSQLWDKEGGFFRYAVQQDWTTPHYEKMLEDNMQLALIYARAYKKTKKVKYLETAKKTVKFCMDRLQLEGRWFGSQAADEEYCKLPPKKRERPPAVDRTTYTPAQASAICTLAEMSTTLRNKKYLDKAKESYQFLQRLKTGKLYCHYYDSEAKKPELATDQISAIEASISLYKAAKDKTYLEEAEKTAKAAQKAFCKKGIYDIRTKGIGLMKQRYLDLQENSRWAIAMQELFNLTGNRTYKKLAEEARAATGAKARTAGTFASLYALGG